METVEWTLADYEAFAKTYAEEKADQIIAALERERNVLCPSFAGSGKSFAVDVVLKRMGLLRGEFVLTSFVGVAALNMHALGVGGRTLNSTFRFPLVSNTKIGEDETADEYVERVARIWASSVRTRKTHAEVKAIMKALKLVVNDEVSMTSGLMLKVMNRCFQLFYRNEKPFGGIRMILLGDWLQIETLDELARDVPDHCHSLLENFERIMFDFGHRYVLKQGDKVIVQTGYVRFLDQLRFGTITLNDFLKVGYKVLTESEYKAQLPDGAMLLMAHTNRKVDAWNNEITQLYRTRTTVTDWSAEPIELSARCKPGFELLNLRTPGAEKIVATAIASGLVDKPEDGSFPEIFVRRLETRELRFLPTLLQGLAGETPIALPMSLELRVGGPVLMRHNRPDGLPLANGSVLKFKALMGCSALLEIDGTSYTISQVPRWTRSRDGRNVIMAMMFPFIQADAITVSKAQGITLSEAGFLLDGTFRQKHSMYVTFSRVKDPTRFTFVVPDRLIDAISDSDPLDPATQQSRLRKIFRKIQDLIRINPQINALVSVWEDTD
jgi:hypothetical protein